MGAAGGDPTTRSDSIASSIARQESIASALTEASVTSTASNVSRLPERLVDFFCVVGVVSASADDSIEAQNQHQQQEQSRRQQQIRHQNTQKQENDGVLLKPCIVDCYPSRRPDMEFPEHISQFCFPNDGCRAYYSNNKKERNKPPVPPSLWTTVLTSANGHRLYAAILTFYEENETNINTIDDKNKKEKSKEKGSGNNYTYYPKCILVLSHYAEFDVFRRFLQQLYRIFKSDKSPLPLERFIANFVHDIPLPPTGRATVLWECFTKRSVGVVNNDVVEIARPGPNELPLVNFSYKPLFSALSVANILVLFGILLQEGRVALCSDHIGLLTPVAEALQSLLFPLQWQGMYIPVLPIEMCEVLDAPVPYIVGLDRRYLRENNKNRPIDVVFVDLDKDIVHLGWSDDQKREPGRIPDLPSREVMELKVLLEELTDHLYLAPVCGLKGRITAAAGKTLQNSEREPYSQMTCLRHLEFVDLKKIVEDHRRFILSTAGNAIADHDNSFAQLEYKDFILDRKEIVLTRKAAEKQSDASTTVAANKQHAFVLPVSWQRQSRIWQAHTDRLLASFAGQTFATSNPFNAGDSNANLKKKRVLLAKVFYDLDHPVNSDGAKFSATAIRRAFLAFFVKLLIRYKHFLKVGRAGEITMVRDAFIKDLPRHMSANNMQYMTEMIGTQMFERFIHDRSRRKLYFDEQIVVERNRSTNSAKQQQPTPFLDDTRWTVRKMIRPRAPCTHGVPAGRAYKFKTFPKLDNEEFELATNPPVSLFSALHDGTLCSACLCWPTNV